MHPLPRVCTAITLGFALATTAARAQPDTVWVHCEVFDDQDADGIRDAGEPGLPQIRITNGVDVFLTGAQGMVDVPVDRQDYRFATLTIPAGRWPSTDWFRFTAGAGAADSVEFGLRSRPETAVDPITWAHITDTHTTVVGFTPPFTSTLAEIGEVPTQPLCIFNTGDLVDWGDTISSWTEYLLETAQAPVPLFNVVGNHDISNPEPLSNYEIYAGPPYYSVEMGSWHLIAWNSEPGSPRQEDWLENDLAAAPPGLHRLVLNHRLSNENPPSHQDLWVDHNVQGVFSGHWHCWQIGQRHTGLRDFNLSWTPLGPIDRTPRGFGLVHCLADGTIRYELRRSGVNHRVTLASPVDADTVSEARVPVLLQAYDSSARVTSATVTLTGPGGGGSVPVVPEGVSLWRGEADLSGLPDGTYTCSVSGQFEDGNGFSTMSTFTLLRRSRPPPSLGEHWPMFRKCVQGSSFTAQPLEPPLVLEWVAPTNGMTALSSPVTAGGNVVFGVRGESAPGDAGVYCFDAETGGPRWFASVPSGVALAPAIASNVVVVNALADSAYGLDLQTGQRIWGFPKANSYDMTAPVFEGSDVWLGGRPFLFQLDWLTGQLVWQSPWRMGIFYPYVYGAVAVGPDRVYAGGFAQSFSTGESPLVALDRMNGSMQVWEALGAWRSPIVTAGDSVLVVGGFTGDGFNPFQFLERRTSSGSVVYSAFQQNLMKETSSPALGHGVLVVSGRASASADGMLFGFDAIDGSVLWSFPVGTELYDMTVGKKKVKSNSSTAAIADDVVWFGSLDGHLYALDLFTGALLWSFDLGTPIASSPAISGDYLFVGASDGHLYAFTRSGPPPTGAHDGAPPRTTFALHRPAPNPSTDGTELRWDLPARTHVLLAIHDVGGRRVRTLADGVLEAGAHRTRWDGRDAGGRRAAAGVYFARLEAVGHRAVRKVVLLAP